MKLRITNLDIQNLHDLAKQKMLLVRLFPKAVFRDSHSCIDFAGFVA
jgi:hypothetical protein